MREEYHGKKTRPKKKKKSHKIYAAIVLTLGIIIICLTILILFYVQRIEIKGNKYCTDKEIAEAIQNDRFSINTLYVLAKYTTGNGEIPVGLDSMEVKLKNPWTISVTVEEKQSVGYIEYRKQRVYFDRDGLVLIQGLAVVKDVPLVEGITFKNIKLHQVLECDDTKVFDEIYQTTQELKKKELTADKIVYINDRMYVYIGKICISLGMDVTQEKIAQINPILKKLENKQGTLHLENYSTGNDTITFAIDEFPKEK